MVKTKKPAQKKQAKPNLAIGDPNFENKQVGVVYDTARTTPFEIRNNFGNSLSAIGSPTNLRNIARNVLFDKAIERISNGVAAIPWIIDPPEEYKDDKKAIAQTRLLTRGLQKPSTDFRHNTYRKFVKSIVRDLCVFGTSAIERQQGDDGKAFWLWNPCAEYVKIDPNWDEDPETPRYWYCPPKTNPTDWKAVYDDELFLIQARVSSYEIACSSPVKLAYDDINTWIGLHGYQARTVSNGVRDYMINIENANEDEVDAFREYWRSDVVGRGEIPVIGGKVTVVKFGAKTDDELFLKYTEILTGLIALYFGLSHRDVGIISDDSYATADVAQAHSFQDAILPVAQIIIEDLDNQVIDYYYPEYSIGVADNEPRKELEEAQRATMVYEKGLSTKNESRRMIGEPPLEGGDTFADGSSPGQKPPAQPGVPGQNPDVQPDVPAPGQNPPVQPDVPNAGQKPPAKLAVVGKTKTKASIAARRTT
jgi:hypothetical protein